MEQDFSLNFNALVLFLVFFPCFFPFRNFNLGLLLFVVKVHFVDEYLTLICSYIFHLVGVLCFSSIRVSINFIIQVVIGEDFVVPAYSKVSLFEEPTSQDSDEELEYADRTSAMAEITCM